VCEKYFAGETDQIKEYNIAVDVLDRPPSFDPSEDAIARVEVHRLRKKLREYYQSEGADHNLRIVIPIGRYVPVFLSAEAASEADARAVNGADTAHIVPAHTEEEESSSLLPAATSAKTWRAAGPFWRRPWVLALGGLGLCAAGALWLVKTPRSESAGVPKGNAANAAAATVPPAAATIPPLAGVATPGIRILCGRREPHSDRWGRL
jgi:hypothetical protein